MTCARTGSTGAVKALISRGVDVNAAEPSLKQTALMWATAEHHNDVVRLLIEHGANVRAATRHGFTALHFAAREGDLESARLLLAGGVDVNVRSVPDPTLKGRGPAFDAMRSVGATPLLTATTRAHVKLALFLLDRGADPNIPDAGFTPLHWAAGTWEGDLSNPVFGFIEPMSGIPDRRAKLQLIEALLARGANPNARVTRRMPGFAGGYSEPVGATAFFLASSVADVEVMRMLLDAGADPSLETEGGTSPLMAAAGVNRKMAESPVTEHQSIQAVKLLLDLGADASRVAANGENALFAPAYRGWNDLAQLLVDRGANVNAVSKAGITPWLAASGLGDRFGGVLFNTETAALLVKLGADPKLGKPCQAQVKCR
jgi:ankyrin repeat protein